MSDYLIKPSFSWHQQEGQDMKVKDWIQSASEGKWDVTLMGVPLSRSSISASAASEFPEAFRRSWSFFSTYYFDDAIDFRTLRAADLGDVIMHGTDILRCHQNIEQAMKDVLEETDAPMHISIGGDHSITAPIVKAFAKSGKRIGILQFDTHLDLRNIGDHGPSNGTPIRQLLDSGIVRGEDVYNIGLHGFYNAPSLIEAAHYYGVNMISLKKYRQLGALKQIQQVMQELGNKVDMVYVTVDMDVLDITYAPGVPASTPGGMRSDELFDLLYEVGKYEQVRAMDFVCIDPHRDTREQQTVKTTAYACLTYLASYYIHQKSNG